MSILLPILIFAAMGLLSGVLLTAASTFFAVKTDPKKEQITEALPGANCGSCGFAGCADYAEAIADGRAEPNLCRPGGADAAGKIGAILGRTVTAAEPMVMAVHCNGTCDAAGQYYEYKGTPTCRAAAANYGGSSMCSYGCLGFGDCMAVCEEDAICLKDGIAHIIADRCLACGKCAAACPKGLLSLRPKSNPVTAACSSSASGKNTKLACKNGCIGCKICEKKCPSGAITVQELHAVIDYAKCTGCGACAEVCPVGVIQK